MADTKRAIIEASSLPLSIVIVGKRMKRREARENVKETAI
jgi:hypothetical protein